MSLAAAISFCPNDTYLFHPWIAGRVGHALPIKCHLADIEQLNTWALSKLYPLIKLSFACFSNVIADYQLLPVGAALGWGCGPKLIAKAPFLLSDLPNKSVAIPGIHTTAHLLLNRLLPPPKTKLFCPYNEIASLIAHDRVDCGLIIHESRFTYEAAGFVEIADLGQMWTSLTQSPIPLGGLAISRHLPSTVKSQVVSILRDSLNDAHQNPHSGIEFILQHSQEKDLSIVQQHIATYVTSETASLSTEGMRAIEHLLDCGQSHNWLYI